jgi:hypothetical protein
MSERKEKKTVGAQTCWWPIGAKSQKEWRLRANRSGEPIGVKTEPMGMGQ